MGIDLTPCGHLRGSFCDKCKPAPQEQVDNSAEFIAKFIAPHLEQWIKSGKMTKQQAVGSLFGISIGMSIELGATRDQIVAAIDQIFATVAP